MPLKPSFVAPIPRNVRRVVTRLCQELQRATSVPHEVEVIVVPAPAVSRPDGACGFGGFAPADGRIYLAGQRPPDVSSAAWQDLVAETLCHELAHYEQWRDGRELTERGVAVRARNLLAKTSYQPAAIPA